MSCGDRYGGRSPIDIRKTGRSNEKKGMGGGIGYAVMVEIEAAFCSVPPSDLATEAASVYYADVPDHEHGFPFGLDFLHSHSGSLSLSWQIRW
jgi:hypothetical protein